MGESDLTCTHCMVKVCQLILTCINFKHEMENVSVLGKGVEGEERWHPVVFISCLCLHRCTIETVKAVNWSFQNRNRCSLCLKA